LFFWKQKQIKCRLNKIQKTKLKIGKNKRGKSKIKKRKTELNSK
jgi:hypothetical protein